MSPSLHFEEFVQKFGTVMFYNAFKPKTSGFE